MLESFVSLLDCGWVLGACEVECQETLILQICKPDDSWAGFAVVFRGCSRIRLLAILFSSCN